MSHERLAIIVPTYNRAHCLRELLGALSRQLAGVGDGLVTVIIGDNASTDDTGAVIAVFLQDYPNAQVIRHDENVGPDENFCRCVESADADYFWLIGDDDLPRQGAIEHILQLIERYQPDLTYLASAWSKKPFYDPSNPVKGGDVLILERLAFARRVNVWTTFISGMVVRRNTFVAGTDPSALRRHAKSHLGQLAWVLGTLEKSKTLLYVREPHVLATAENTGGYKVLRVFGQNFPAIVIDHFGMASPLTRAFVGRCMLCFMPGLVWAVRRGKAGAFENEDPSAMLLPPLARYPASRLLVSIAKAPRPLAMASLLICKVASRVVTLADRLRDRLSESVQRA